MEPDTHPSFDIVKGGKRKKVLNPLTDPEKPFSDLRSDGVNIRESRLNVKHDTRRLKDMETLVTQEKKQDAVKRIAPPEKLKTIKKPVIKKNTSVKAKPVPDISTSNVKKQASVKERIATVRNKATPAVDRSVQKIRSAGKSRAIPQMGLGLALTKTKLNSLANIPSNARIESTRTTVIGTIINESKQQALNIEGMTGPTNIRGTCMKELPREASIHARLKQEVAQYPDRIHILEESLSGLNLAITKAGDDLKDCIQDAAEIPRRTTNARRDADKAQKTLGDSSSGMMHDHDTLSAAVAARPADPRLELARTAAKDADAFRNTRDSNADPSQNGLHDKMKSDTYRNQARAESLVHETARANAVTREKDNISDMSSKQKEYDTFIKGLDTTDNAISMYSNTITLVGGNLQSVLKPNKTDAQNAVTRTEAMKKQNGIDIQRTEGEVVNLFSELRDATKERDARLKDINDINNKLSDLGKESTGYKNDLNQAGSGLSQVEHDAIHSDKFARLEEIRDRDLPENKNALRKAGERRDTALKARGYLAPNQDIPDIATLNANSKDIGAKLSSVRGLHDPEIENRRFIDESIRRRITERDAVNKHLEDVNARIRAYEPAKPMKDPSPTGYERKDPTTILADRDRASSLLNTSAKKSAVQGGAAKDMGGALSANRTKRGEAAAEILNLLQKRNTNSETIEGVKTNWRKDISYREGANTDIENLRSAQKKVSTEAGNLLLNSTLLNDIINIKREEAGLNNGILEAIKNRAGDALTAYGDAKASAQIRDAAQDTAVRSSKDRDITNRARNEAANDAKIHSNESNNAAKRLVDAKSGDSSAKNMDVAEDVSAPDSTTKYNKALTDVNTNLSPLKRYMAKAAEGRKNLEGLENDNIKNIDKGIKEASDRSADVGVAARVHAKDVDTIAELIANLEYLATKPGTLKVDVDAAFALAETNRPTPNVDLADKAVELNQMKDEYTAKLREATLRQRDAEESLKLLTPESTKLNPKIMEKVNLDKALKEVHDKETVKLDLVKKNKKPVDEKLGKNRATKNRLVASAGYSLSLIGNLMNVFVTPETIKGNGASKSITPESDSDLPPDTDSNEGSDYTDGYNVGMTQGKIEGQKDGTTMATNILSRMDTEPIDKLIKELVGDGNLDAATTDVLKGTYCKHIAKSAEEWGDSSTADPTCVSYYKGAMKGGYEEDENGTMIPKMEIYEGGASPTEDFDNGYSAGYNYGYKLWYNASLQVTMSLRDEPSSTSLSDVSSKQVETSQPLSVSVESSEPIKPSVPQGGGLKNAKRHVKRGNTFRQHSQLLRQIKGKTIAV